MADELRSRAERRLAATLAEARAVFGDPRRDPPPHQLLPPALARLSAATTFALGPVAVEHEETSASITVIIGHAASAGVVVGRARVVSDLALLLDLEPGTSW